MDHATAAQLELIQAADLPIRERVRCTAVEPEPTDPAGCFVVNTLVELAPHGRELADALDRDHLLKVGALTTAIRAAHSAGELAPHADAAALADYVYVVLGGLRVAARRRAPCAGRRGRGSCAATLLTHRHLN